MTTIIDDYKDLYIEALEDIKEHVPHYDGYICDLHNDVFNTDYYIIGTYAAEQCLESLGVFDVIRTVQEYEDAQFGERYTDYADPEKLANMLYYVVGDQVISDMLNDADYDELSDAWNDVITDETRQAILHWINKTLEALK